MELLAKDFANRSELETKVRNKFGLTPDLKPDHVIKGTREELSRLQLSDKRIFWGISCEITDTPTQLSKQAEKPARGEVFEHGINLEADKKGKKKHAKPSE